MGHDHIPLSAVLAVTVLSLVLVPGCPTQPSDDDDEPGPLVAPAGLTGLVIDGGYRLRWGDTNGDEDGYRVERRAGAESEFAALGELDADAVELVDGAFDAAQEYVYRVVAVRGEARSDPAELDSTVPYWTYVRCIGYDALWGDSGPDMAELIAGHITWDMESRGGSNANISLLLLGDSYGDEGSIYAHVGANGTEFLERDELNMGDVQTYRDFFDWAVANHPGQHYVVSYWSHGSGSAFKGGDGGDRVPKSIGFDATDDDELDPEETAEALAHLAELAGNEVQVFSVCACLTQMVENAYALRDAVLYFVAGETSVGCGCDVLDVLYDQPDQTPREIADATVAAHHSTWENDVVFSSVDVTKTPEMAAELDALAQVLEEYIDADPAAHTEAIKQAAAQAQNMDYAPDYGTIYAIYLDLIDLCEELEGLGDDRVASQARAVRDFAEGQLITSTMLQNDYEGLYGEAHGISILHPSPVYAWWDPAFYGTLSFAQDTGWDEYLSVLYP